MLVRNAYTGKMRVFRNPVEIGSKFVGHGGSVNTFTGDYYETMPKIEGDALKIQRAILAPDRKVRGVDYVIDWNFGTLIPTDTKGLVPTEIKAANDA